MKFPSLTPLCLALSLGLLGVSVSLAADPEERASSGFLTDYDRLHQAGTMRGRYLAHASPEASVRQSGAVYLMPVVRFPAEAVFPGIDEAVTLQVLRHVDARLRAQLSKRGTVVAAAEGAERTLQVALTGLAAQPESKTLLDLVPLRLITSPVRNALQGKALEAGGTLEVRLADARSNAVLRESLHPLSGSGIGRAGDGATRVSFPALQPALDAWVEAVVELVFPKP